MDPTRENAVNPLDEVLDVMKPGGGAATLVSEFGDSLKKFDLFFVFDGKACKLSCSLEPICDIPGSDDPLLVVTFLNTLPDSVPFDKYELSRPRPSCSKTGEYSL